MKNFISLLDFSCASLMQILDRADELSKKWKKNEMPQPLFNMQVGLWFYGQGFRNRVAFEIGSRAMGASVSYIPGELGIHEPLEDVVSYLQNWYSLLVVRAKNHADLEKLAATTSIPVINARTNLGHPCEIMGDLQYIRRRRGSLEDLKVVFVGEATNLGMSWFEASKRFPISVTQVAPEKYLATKDILRKIGKNTMGQMNVTTDLNSVIERADLVYTDCWPKVDSEEQSKEVKDLFTPYQITERHLSKLNENAIFLPCPPVTQGQEVSSEAMLSKHCLNSKAKDCLLHSQNAIMEFLVEGR